MPKKSTLPGKIGDIARAIGAEEARRRLGLGQKPSLADMAHRRREWSEEFHNRVSNLHKEVCECAKS